jgi:eukaryotic-like serine/threonine-protein kinase
MIRFEGTDRYEIVGQLGQGGMGCVYEAHDRTSGERVALKTLRPKDAHSLVRFKREFRTIARLKHPNLVRLYELSTWANGIFFTMEKIVGVDLRTYLEGAPSEDPDDADTIEVRLHDAPHPDDSFEMFGVDDEGGADDWSDLGSHSDPPTMPSVDLVPDSSSLVAGAASNPFVDIFGAEPSPLGRSTATTSSSHSATIGAREPAPYPMCDPERLRDCLAQILDAIEYLHLQGIVHRDLKPDNILVTAGGVVKVVDFGIMKDLFEARTVTVTGGILGTLAYIPPESTGDTIGPAADLYTLGCITFEMLAGSAPFPGSSIRTLWRHQNEPAPALSSRVSGAGDGFEDLCESLLAKDPADRLSIPEIRALVGLERRASGRRPETMELTPIAMPGPDEFADRIGAGLAGACDGTPRLVLLAADPGDKLQEVLGCVVTILAPERFQIFRGICTADEDIHYRALDAIIDDLALSVARLPRNSLRRLEEAVRQCTVIFPAFRLVYERRSEILGPAPQMTDFSNHQMNTSRFDRATVLEALGSLLSEITRENPALFVIDNLADADAGSFDLLRELLDQSIGRVAILCLLRPTDLFSDVPVRDFRQAVDSRQTVDTFILH